MTSVCRKVRQPFKHSQANQTKIKIYLNHYYLQISQIIQIKGAKNQYFSQRCKSGHPRFFTSFSKLSGFMARFFILER